MTRGALLALAVIVVTAAAWFAGRFMNGSAEGVRTPPSLVPNLLDLQLAEHAALRDAIAGSGSWSEFSASAERVAAKAAEAEIRASTPEVKASAAELRSAVASVRTEAEETAAAPDDRGAVDVLHALSESDVRLYRLIRELDVSTGAPFRTGGWGTAISYGAVAVIVALLVSLWLRALVRHAFREEGERHAQLVARSLEHHVNNALAVIVTNAHLLAHHRVADDAVPEVESEIYRMSQRIRNGIRSLRNFRSLETESFGEAGEVLKLERSEG